jgi:ABC-type transport system involved in multi-copper enzyme maturation permease subunit
LVVTVALAATRSPSELERRTVYGLLVRDVRRREYLVGTWLGIVLVTGVVLLAASAVTLAVGFIAYGSIMLQLLGATFAVWLEMGVLTAFGIVLSTRVGAVTSSVGMLTFVFVGHSVSTLLGGGDAHAGGAQWYVPSLEVFDVINPVAHGTGYSPMHAVVMLVAFLAWSIALLSIATAVFERRDL